MVRHLVEQGFTVFMVSWRNPNTSMEGTTIEDYVDLGPLAASDVVMALRERSFRTAGRGHVGCREVVALEEQGRVHGRGKRVGGAIP
jgi:poly(3-hydroxyalkanoate) synthetase